MSDTETLVEEEVDVNIDELIENILVLYNDDVNSFQHVIICLMKYCEHTPIQAEQCANIVHYNGKCMIKKGSMDKLKPIKEALTENGLDAKIH